MEPQSRQARGRGAVVTPEQTTRDAVSTRVRVSLARISSGGVIVNRDGVVVTTAHVVGDARTVEVGLADGRTLRGDVLGRDQTIDVAIVRVAAQNLPTAPVGDS